ncbi:MAG: hypothetical protein ABIK68_16070 [bacterium]
MKKIGKGLSFAAVGLVLVLLNSCASSSSDDSSSSSTGTYSTSVQALSVNSKVSVIEAGASAATSKVNALKLDYGAISAAIAVSNFSAASDYAKDETFVYVRDDTSQALNTVNSILCYFDQIQPDDMLNRGNYKAQVDESQCNQNKGGSSGGSSSGGGADKSSSSTVSYSYWVVNSARADNSSNQVVKAWVAGSEDDPQYIKAKLTISEGKSATNSLGIFRLDFVGYKTDSAGNPTAETTMTGFMYSERNADGQVALKFYDAGSHDEDGKSFGYEEGINVVRNTAGTEGYGSTLGQQWGQAGPTPVTYNFAFNENYFYRSDADNKKACMNRKDFNETAWRYGLYDASGSRVDLNSGFPIKAESGGQTYHGWIGYWGLWMPSNAGIVNGSTVIKEAFGENETEQSYTVFQVGGKLEKHTKKTLTMAEIRNIPLSWYDNSNGTEFQVMWNGTSLVKKATRTQATNWQWQALSPEQTLTFTAGTFGFFFYSESLGGDGQIKFDNWEAITGASGQSVTPTVSASSTVIFHVRDTVFPGDTTVPASFVCYDNCPDPSKMDQANYFFTSDWNNPVKTEYTFSGGVLKYNGTDVVMSTAGSGNQNGVWSGALFANTASNLAALACPWDSSQTCAWQAWEKLSTYYTWSTGPNDWQKLTTLASGGSYLTFDSPMQVKYTHASGTYAGTVFYLDYQGFGNLNGIPEMCINTETGANLDCWSLTESDYESGKIRWMRKFVIPNGSLAVGTGTTATEYVIKALDVEQAMKKVADAVCDGAGLSLSSHTLPVLSQWSDPAIGDEPTVTAAPAVIGGVVQITLN